MDKLHKGWFSEINEQWPGIAISLEIESVLFDERSEYQHVQVFSSKTFGNVLVLDGVIQLTDRDEHAYQEMMTHPAMMAHPNPERVLVVGGGDGGVIREVVKHDTVKEVVICEIDKVVIECGKKYFPSVASAWDDPRVTLVCGDAAEYIARKENFGKFDVIISDTSDPVGPAEALFQPPFYKAMNKALRAGGRIATQAESLWLHTDLIEGLVRATSSIFEHVGYTTTQIPTYPGGQIGILQCKKADATPQSYESFTKVSREPSPALLKQCKYYTAKIHDAAWVLPSFAQQVVDRARAAAIEDKKRNDGDEHNNKKQRT